VSQLISFSDQASGSLILAGGAAAALGVAVAGSFRPRIGAPAALLLALAATAALSAGATAYDANATRASAAALLPPDHSWIDHAATGDVTLLRGPGSAGHDGMEQLFWNRSVTRVALLPGAAPIDSFASPVVSVTSSGRLRLGSAPVRGTLLLDQTASTIQPRDGRVLARTKYYVLWQTRGQARLALEVRGRSADGWLASRGWVEIWPASGNGLHGRLMFRLQASGRPNTVRLRVAGGPQKTVRLTARGSTSVSLPVCSAGPARISFAASNARPLNGHIVAVRGSLPVFRPDPRVC
jgi:hypothetical protein